MPVNTKSVTGRRELSFQNYDELLRDAEQMAAVPNTTLGNWSYAQILQHIAISLNASIEGIPFKASLPMRIMGKWFMRGMFLNRTLSPGFSIPKAGEDKFVPDTETSVEDGLNALRAGIERCKNDATRTYHPVLENISTEDWDKFNLRHAEMHMSFVVPSAS